MAGIGRRAGAARRDLRRAAHDAAAQAAMTAMRIDAVLTHRAEPHAVRVGRNTSS
jgi:hypothetical protein